MKIACVGDNCVDYYDNTGEVFPGGNPVNVAVYVRRMGGQSAYLGAVGTDAYGGLILQALEEKGYEFISADVAMVPSTRTALTDPDDLKKMGLLLDHLEEDDDVQNIWHNLENEEDLDR